MKLLTNNLRVFAAQQLVDSIQQGVSNYYFFMGRSYPFENDGDISGNQPTINDNVFDTYYSVYDDMIGGKKVGSSDVAYMVRKYEWAANTVYRRYDDTMTDPFNENEDQLPFYVVATNGGERCVYKCIDNNGGLPTGNIACQPTEVQASDDIYMTPDGYSWKFLYKYDSTIQDKFETQNYIPCIENANVVANAISGSIDVIDIVSPGLVTFNGVANGVFEDVVLGGNNQIFKLQSNTIGSNTLFENAAIYLSSGPGAGEQRRIVFYDQGSKTVVIDAPFDSTPANTTQYEISPNVVIGGDGSGAMARAVVNAVSGKIHKVLVTSRGAGYTYALAMVQGYTGVVANSTNQPELRVIMPPKGGHGADVVRELGARHVGITTTFNYLNSSSRLVGKNDFRIVGLIQDPLFTKVTLTINATPTQVLTDNQLITQPSTNAYGTVVERIDSDTVVLSNVHGIFVTSANIVANSTVNVYATSVVGPGEYFDQTHRFIVTNLTAEQFEEDQAVYQPTREDSSNVFSQSFFNATGMLHYANNTTQYQQALLKVVNKKGTFNNADLSQDWTIAGRTSSTSEPAANVLSQEFSDVVYGSGNVLYIENMVPVTCNTGQTETFKLILGF